MKIKKQNYNFLNMDVCNVKNILVYKNIANWKYASFFFFWVWIRIQCARVTRMRYTICITNWQEGESKLFYWKKKNGKCDNSQLVSLGSYS